MGVTIPAQAVAVAEAARLAGADGAERYPSRKFAIGSSGGQPALWSFSDWSTIQREIEDQLSEKILFGEVKPGQIVVVDAASEGSDEPFVFKGTERSELPDEVPEELTSSAGENNDGQ